MTRNTTGTIRSASAGKNSASRNENRLATAAATIPRGASHARNPCSFHVSPVPHDDTATASGRTTSISAARNRSGPGDSMIANALGSSRAESTMNNSEIRSTRRSSLNSTIRRTDTYFWLAMMMPSSVASSSPASSCNEFETANAAITTMSATGFWSQSGTSRRCRSTIRSPAASTATPTPTTSSNAIPVASAPHTDSCVPAASAGSLIRITASRTRTARMAPIGSIVIPSHLAIVPTRPAGRTWRSSGSTTVGPVTVKSAPITTATSHENPAR